MTQKIILSLTLALGCLPIQSYADSAGGDAAAPSSSLDGGTSDSGTSDGGTSHGGTSHGGTSDGGTPSAAAPCLPSEDQLTQVTGPASANITNLQIRGYYLQFTISNMTPPENTKIVTWFYSQSINQLLRNSADSVQSSTKWKAKCQDDNSKDIILEITNTDAKQALDASEQAARPRFLLDVLSGPIFTLASSRPLVNTFAYPVAANVSFEPMFYIPTELSTWSLLLGLPISFYFDPANERFAVSMLPVGIQLEKRVSSVIQFVLQTDISLLQYRQAAAEPNYLGKFGIRLGVRSVIASSLALGFHYGFSVLTNLSSGAGILFTGIQASVGYIR